MRSAISILGWGAGGLLLLACAVWALNWAWWRPRRQERALRSQGLHGTPYRLLRGDLKEDARLLAEARSKPMPLSHHIIHRVAPLLHAAMSEFGKLFDVSDAFTCAEDNLRSRMQVEHPLPGSDLYLE
ncbi:hypothetical protein BHM03_00050962 [Ensete ventricosum]|nr:hypothetical protein BHM03_00050962 [Ensete ventricosum]